jgi:hypothetical protein
MRKDYKRISRRNATAYNVIFIFKQTLLGKRPIQIYNEIRRQEPTNTITKKDVSIISKGNVKIFETELSKEDYNEYVQLREQITNVK